MNDEGPSRPTSVERMVNNTQACEAYAEIPKILWMMWLQGFAQAPDIVKNCYRSWCKHNPNWNIVFLDEVNLHEYVDVPRLIGRNRPDIKVQAFSDFVRINLLARYGGVWADATCFACRPLDSWIHDYTASGFFAFRNPASDRMLSSWFLASAADCYLTCRYREEVNRFLAGNRFDSRGSEVGKTRVNRWSMALYADKRLARLWPLYVMARLMRAYPYYWFHYIFAGLVNKDDLFRQLWRDTPEYRAAGPLSLWRSGYWKPASEELKQEIDDAKVPLYKLHRHIDKQRYTRGSTLNYLLRSIEAESSDDYQLRLLLDP